MEFLYNRSELFLLNRISRNIPNPLRFGAGSGSSIRGNIVETSARIPSGTQEASAPKSVNEDKRYLQKIFSIEDTEGKTWEAKSRRRARFVRNPIKPKISINEPFDGSISYKISYQEKDRKWR